jgi:hypothetical protein
MGKPVEKKEMETLIQKVKDLGEEGESHFKKF